MAVSPDRDLLASGRSDRVVRLWDIRDWHNRRDVVSAQEPLTLLDMERPIYSLAFSPDGKLVLAGAEDRVFVWRTATEAVAQELCAEPLSEAERERITDYLGKEIPIMDTCAVQEENLGRSPVTVVQGTSAAGD